MVSQAFLSDFYGAPACSASSAAHRGTEARDSAAATATGAKEQQAPDDQPRVGKRRH